MKILALILLLCYYLSFSDCGRQDGVCPVDEYQCGKENGGRICPQPLCCSSFGWCGTGDSYCGTGCQNNCPDKPNPEPECGDTVVNKLPCSNGKCCSQYGFCGDTVSYCDIDCLCQSNCWSTPPASPPPPPPTPPPPTPPSPPPPPTPPSPPPPPAGDGVASIITKELFEEMLLHRNDAACPGKGFYTYEAFIEAANFFKGFGTTGDLETRKRELAAFFGQTSHETTGGWPTAPGGPYAWGYCFKEEIGATDPYCVPSQEWPCVPGKKYYGRGPIQISYNYNYGPAGKAIGHDLLSDPDLVASDSAISFETAIWFWMTPQSPKPSCHDVMIGEWTPSESDIQAGRLPGYGVTTNIINGGLECGIGTDPRVEDRIGFYKRYCDMLGVSYGDNLDCNNQRPFGSVTECYGINCVVDM